MFSEIKSWKGKFKIAYKIRKGSSENRKVSLEVLMFREHTNIKIGSIS